MSACVVATASPGVARLGVRSPRSGMRPGTRLGRRRMWRARARGATEFASPAPRAGRCVRCGHTAPALRSRFSALASVERRRNRGRPAAAEPTTGVRCGAGRRSGVAGAVSARSETEGSPPQQETRHLPRVEASGAQRGRVLEAPLPWVWHRRTPPQCRGLLRRFVAGDRQNCPVFGVRHSVLWHSHLSEYTASPPPDGQMLANEKNVFEFSGDIGRTSARTGREAQLRASRRPCRGTVDQEGGGRLPTIFNKGVSLPMRRTTKGSLRVC